MNTLFPGMQPYWDAHRYLGHTDTTQQPFRRTTHREPSNLLVVKANEQIARRNAIYAIFHLNDHRSIPYFESGDSHPILRATKTMKEQRDHHT
jgi:hypothetical protein